MPGAEQLANEKARERQRLEASIEQDTELFEKHKKENAEALREKSHPDHYFAQSKAAVIAGRISQNLKKMVPLKTRGTGLVEKMAHDYASIAQRHANTAQLAKPHGYASMNYQEMRKAVEENREIFDKTVLRNRMLSEAADLENCIPRSGKANPQLLAKLHSGIRSRLLEAASYTRHINDGGKGRIPTPEELLLKAKYHGKKHEYFTSQILKNKQEQTRRTQARSKA